MGSFKYFVAATLIVFGFQVKAQSVAETLLTRDILTSAKTLKSPKKIYNYFWMQKVHPQLETEQGRHAYIVSYLSARGGDFWRFDFTNTSPSNYAGGAGLYFAIDPLISQTYGDTFIEVTMPTGTRFINVVKPIPLKKDTLAALTAEGLITKDQIPLLFPKATGFYRDTLRMMVDPQFTSFRKMVHHIFSTQQIQFVEYNFNTSLGNFCKTHSYSAFVYVGTENVSDPAHAIVQDDFQNTMLYSTVLDYPNLSPAEQARKTEILKFRTTLENIKDKSSATSKKIISETYSPEEYLAVKDSAYSCE